MDLPHRGRSILADDAGKHRDDAAVARGDRDAGDQRLSSAGDARGDRGDPWSHYFQGNAGRAAGNRVDTSARSPQDAGPAADLRYYGSFPVAVQPGGAGRPSGPRGTEGDGPLGFAPAVRLHGSDPA